MKSPNCGEGAFGGNPCLAPPPTCVGKTMPKPDKPAPSVKHPHVRGEDTIRAFFAASLQRTPPRAWGRHPESASLSGEIGNTPTCVGKTNSGPLDQVIPSETPPRAWGRLYAHQRKTCNPRNTPTCVGKTLSTARPRFDDRKHPHVRGEDPIVITTSESSGRNTPTCVGKTRCAPRRRCRA